MMKEFFYRIADLGFTLLVPEGWDIDAELPSFGAFRNPCSQNDELFRMQISLAAPSTADVPKVWLDQSESDFGRMDLYRLGNGYQIEIRYEKISPLFVLQVDKDFTRATAYLNNGSTDAGRALTAMIHIVYSQSIISRGGISLHASTVHLAGQGYLFLGKSGTGKSTHARLWQNAFPGCGLLNDDNPVIRLKGNDEVMVYGTPWSGKTPCYKNLGFPAKGITRLAQAARNEFAFLKDSEAFVALLPSCSVIYCDVSLRDRLCDTLVAVCERIRIGRLECRPDKEAALLCYKNLNECIE